ncbi:MAG TPA: hypothetical protein VH621_04115 [Nitrososphaera sp.]|jgi:hypothetical protein
MVKRLGRLIAVALMAATIVFSAVQLNSPVVSASGADDCPPGYSVFCGNCWLDYALVWPQGGVIITECHYSCYCASGGGGGEPFYIEQTVYLYD